MCKRYGPVGFKMPEGLDTFRHPKKIARPKPTFKQSDVEFAEAVIARNLENVADPAATLSFIQRAQLWLRGDDPVAAAH